MTPRSPATRANKRCPKCGETDPPCGFGRNGARPDKLSDYCADCRLSVSRLEAANRKRRELQASHKSTDDERYRPIAYEAPGRFSCQAKDCETPEFTTAEALECHQWMRHGGADVVTMGRGPRGFVEDIHDTKLRCSECNAKIPPGFTSLAAHGPTGNVLKRVCSQACAENFEDRYWSGRSSGMILEDE